MLAGDPGGFVDLSHRADGLTHDRPALLGLVTRGLLWSVDKLNDSYLKTAKKE